MTTIHESKIPKLGTLIEFYTVELIHGNLIVSPYQIGEVIRIKESAYIKTIEKRIVPFDDKVRFRILLN